MISTAQSRIQSQVLNAFQQTTGRLFALPELELITGLERAVIVDAIKQLRESGIEIEENAREFALGSIPDTLVPAVILCNLKSRSMGCQIHCYKNVGSTNEVARHLADSGAPEGTLVVSERQTRGRGRLGRSWHSPGALGLYFSLVLRPQIPFARMPALSQVAALALCRVMDDYGDLQPQIKWPNDCLLGGRKVAGILVELSAELDRVSYAVLGIGVNVNNQKKDFPASLRSKATSLAIEVGMRIDRADLLRRLLHGFERSYNNFVRYGLRFIGPELVKRSAILGKKISVSYGRKKITGLAMGLDANGAIRLKTRNGVEIISAGEVTPR